jgi:hypothetical protein
MFLRNVVVLLLDNMMLWAVEAHFASRYDVRKEPVAI